MYNLPHTLDDDTYIADPRHPARLPKPRPQNLREEARASQIRTARSDVAEITPGRYCEGVVSRDEEHEAGGAWRTMPKDEKTAYFALAINTTDTKEEYSLILNMNV